MRTLIVVAIVAAAGTAHAQVYRCTEGGRTVYSDKPCGDSARSVSVPVPVTQGTAVSAADAGDAQLQSSANVGRIVVTMTRAQVETAWGKPNDVSATTTSRGRSEQWMYHRNGGTQYVYFENGRVTSYTERASTVPMHSALDAMPAIPARSERDAAQRAELADARRFIRVGESRSNVEGRIGPPDAFAAEGIYFVTTYAPTAKDYQTRTTVYYDVDGRVVKVERKVER